MSDYNEWRSEDKSREEKIREKNHCFDIQSVVMVYSYSQTKEYQQYKQIL